MRTYRVYFYLNGVAKCERVRAYTGGQAQDQIHSRYPSAGSVAAYAVGR